MIKKIIISEEQLNELIGYCDGIEQDYCENGATEIFTGDHKSDDEYADKNATSDDIAKMRANDIGGLWKIGGVSGNLVMREENAHGNQRLNNRQFGDNSDSYNNATVKKSRLKAAEQDAHSNDIPTRQRALKTIEAMKTNTPDIDSEISQINGAQMSDKSMQQSKIKRGEPVMNVTSRNNGGKAHSTKDNTVKTTYFN